MGKQHLSVGMLIDTLTELDVQSVRVISKAYFRSINLGMDLGNPNHPMAETNWFDLGSMYEMDEVCLMMPRHANVQGERKTLYPMLARIGEGYGSLKVEYKHREHGVTMLKVFPLLVQALKAFDPKEFVHNPKRVKACRRARAGMERAIGILSAGGSMRGRLGGVKTVVRLYARTLVEACEKARNSGLLDLGVLDREYILFRRIRKNEYLDFVREALAEAVELQVFNGDDLKKVGLVRQSIIAFLVNAIGWNDGRCQVPGLVDGQEAW